MGGRGGKPRGCLVAVHATALIRGCCSWPVLLEPGMYCVRGLNLTSCVIAQPHQCVMAQPHPRVPLATAGPEEVSEQLLQRPATLSALVSSLLSAFAVEPAGASVLLHTRAPLGSYAEPAPLQLPSAAARAGTGDAGSSSSSGGGMAGSSAPSAASAAGAPSTPAPGGAILMPRMPLMLAHLGSHRNYLAAASVARAVGRLARASDHLHAASSVAGPQRSRPAGSGGGLDLHRLLDAVLSKLSARVASLARRPGGAAAERRGHGGGGGWQCEAAAAVVVATEVLFGASAAWQPPLNTPGDGGSAQAGAAAGALLAVPPVGVRDAAYESQVQQLLQLVTQEPLWGLASSLPDEAGMQEAALPSAQVGALGGWLSLWGGLGCCCTCEAHLAQHHKRTHLCVLPHDCTRIRRPLLPVAPCSCCPMLPLTHAPAAPCSR